MTTTFEKLSSNKVKLGFTVEPEKFDEGLQTAYRKLVKQISIPGFRRGKAPMRVIESHYGPSVFYEDAFEAIFPEIYRAGLEEHGVEPVDSPELDIEQIGRGKELKFTVEVFVRPDVKLGEYKNLGLKKEVAEVTDDDVNADIERARERAARYVEITDRPAKLDDQVNIDYAGYLGSFYKTSESSALAANPDTVEAYIPRVDVTFNVTQDDGSVLENWPLIADGDTYSQGNKYLVYCGGDQPYEEITNNDMTEGPSCIVVKESFGNCFIPFLVNHYKNVYVVDYRHYEAGTVTQLAQEKGVDDVLLLSNISMTRNEGLVSQFSNIF